MPEFLVELEGPGTTPKPPSACPPELVPPLPYVPTWQLLLQFPGLPGGPPSTETTE
jgi:hypothetical protein